MLRFLENEDKNFVFSTNGEPRFSPLIGDSIKMVGLLKRARNYNSIGVWVERVRMTPGKA